MSDTIRELLSQRIAIDGMSPAQRDLSPDAMPGLWDAYLRHGDERDIKPKPMAPLPMKPPIPDAPRARRGQRLA